jgi:hypothetical protein
MPRAKTIYGSPSSDFASDMPSESEQMNAPMIAPSTATTQKPSFVPVIERVMNHSEAIGFNSNQNVALHGDAKKDISK